MKTLEPFFPEVRTLAGAKRYRGTATIRKSPITIADLLFVSHDLAPSTDHDDLLFNAQLNTGFTALLRLGELTWPNKIALQNNNLNSIKHYECIANATKV